MSTKEFAKLVKKHRGWVERGRAYFPSVWHKEQFEKEWANQ